MERVEQLKALIASYWQIPSDAVDWDLPLTGEHLKNFTSLRTLRFLASVEEQFHINIQEPGAITHFKDLLPLIEQPCER